MKRNEGIFKFIGEISVRYLNSIEKENWILNKECKHPDNQCLVCLTRETSGLDLWLVQKDGDYCRMWSMKSPGTGTHYFSWDLNLTPEKIEELILEEFLRINPKMRPSGIDLIASSD